MGKHTHLYTFHEKNCLQVTLKRNPRVRLSIVRSGQVKMFPDSFQNPEWSDDCIPREVKIRGEQ